MSKNNKIKWLDNDADECIECGSTEALIEVSHWKDYAYARVCVFCHPDGHLLELEHLDLTSDEDKDTFDDLMHDAFNNYEPYVE